MLELIFQYLLSYEMPKQMIRQSQISNFVTLIKRFNKGIKEKSPNSPRTSQRKIDNSYAISLDNKKISESQILEPRTKRSHRTKAIKIKTHVSNIQVEFVQERSLKKNNFGVYCEQIQRKRKIHQQMIEEAENDQQKPRNHTDKLERLKKINQILQLENQCLIHQNSQKEKEKIAQQTKQAEQHVEIITNREPQQYNSEISPIVMNKRERYMTEIRSFEQKIKKCEEENRRRQVQSFSFDELSEGKKERYYLFQEQLKISKRMKEQILKKTFVIQKLPLIGPSPKNSLPICLEKQRSMRKQLKQIQHLETKQQKPFEEHFQSSKQYKNSKNQPQIKQKLSIKSTFLKPLRKINQKNNRNSHHIRANQFLTEEGSLEQSKTFHKRGLKNTLQLSGWEDSKNSKYPNISTKG